MAVPSEAPVHIYRMIAVKDYSNAFARVIKGTSRAGAGHGNTRFANPERIGIRSRIEHWEEKQTTAAS